MSPDMLLSELYNSVGGIYVPKDFNHSVNINSNNNHINIEEILNDDERKIYEVLDVYPKTLDMIWEEMNQAETCEMTIFMAMQCLVGLCVKGVAEQVHGSNIYKIKQNLI